MDEGDSTITTASAACPYDHPLDTSSISGFEAISPLSESSSSTTTGTSPDHDPSDVSCSILSKLLAARASSLRRCTTVVTRSDGRCYQEARTADGFTALSSRHGNPSGVQEKESVLRNQKEHHQSLGATVRGQVMRQSTDNSDVGQTGTCGVVLVSPHRSKDVLSVDELNKCSSNVLFNRKCPGFVIDTKPDLRCTVILPYLLLGSQDVANDRSILDQFKVTRVLSLVPPSLFNSEPQKILQCDGTVVTVQPSVTAGVRSDGGIDCNSLTSLNRNLQDAGATLQEPPVSHPSGLTGDSPFSEAVQSSTQCLTPEVIYAPMLDIPEHQILESFLACHRFLAGVKRAGGVVLVHCNAGVSRAPTVVIAYLMTEYGRSYEEALGMVQEKRTFIRPNAGFVEQLKQYESLLKNRNT